MEDSLVRTGRLFGAVRNDYSRRRGHFCTSDWSDGLRSSGKTLSGALYMFFATFASTVALAEVARRHTGAHLGVSEYVLGNAVSGILHVLLGTQPLLILRPTGPITAISIQLHAVSTAFNVDFWTLYGWTGVFVGVYCTLIAAFDVCALIRHVSRFTYVCYRVRREG